jgi:hypothetical protein
MTLTQSLPILALLPATLVLGQEAQQKSSFATDSAEQYQALAEGIKQNSYPISLWDGKLVGPGMELLARSGANAQFVLFAEEPRYYMVSTTRNSAFPLIMRA